MIFDKETWLRFGHDFWVYDGTLGFEDGRYGFVMSANPNEADDELLANTRFLFIKEDQPMESRFFRLDSEYFGFTTISAGWSPSETEFVAVDGNSVLSYKPKVYKGIEKSIDGTLPDTTLVSSTTKTVRVANTIYAVGNPVRVYKRLGQNNWINNSDSIPIPAGFKSGSTIGNEFYDLAGFSETDMYAVGGEGNVWHFDGKLWQQIAFPTNIELDTVVCAEDGNVYITDITCSIWVGRNSTWRKVCEEDMSLRFFDSAWFANRLWCANDYGMWVLEDDKLIPAQNAKEKPMPEDMLGLCNRIDVSPDGRKMLICGPDGAAVYDGRLWNVLFDRKRLEN